MNLFFLDDDPRVAATMLADKHVGKMLIECCQMMSTAARKWGHVGGYADTHVNHPMTLWVGESRPHFEWCWEHALGLAWEYQHRWGRDHGSAKVLPTLSVAMWTCVPDVGWRNPPRCIPDEFKLDYDTYMQTRGEAEPSCHVASYRGYYACEKAHLHKWTRRDAPLWLLSAGVAA